MMNDDQLRVIQGLNRSLDCVIEVGVRTGTPWLYNCYPDVPHILVDPQDKGEALLKCKPSKYVFLNVAVGGKSGLEIFQEQGLMSTFLSRTQLTTVPTLRTYEVEVTTLDEIISLHAPTANNIGLKIDTEGFELEVISGLQKYLDRVDFIISEVSVLNRFENSYNFSELVGSFLEKGFRFYNILGGVIRPAPRVYDCIFFKASDPIFDSQDLRTRKS